MAMTEILDSMQSHGLPIPPNKMEIKIDGAETILHNCFTYFLSLQGKEYQPQAEYKRVADWLGGNNGKGLLLYGNCGRGKSYLARYVIPAILLKYQRRVSTIVDATELGAKVDEIKKCRLLIIDDIGTEHETINYGQRRNPFEEIVDSFEKLGGVIIITTNLSKGELLQRYGERTLTRLEALTDKVLFKGKCLR